MCGRMVSDSTLLEAVRDLRYLLSRGYNREGAVKFVGDRYQLNRQQRLILYRAVYDRETAAAHRRKMVPPSALKGRKVAVDGYNNLLTIESLLKGRLLLICDDGFVRDVSAIHGRHKPTEITTQALNLLLRLLRELKPSKIIFSYDAQVSFSGELAAQTRKMLLEYGLHGEAHAVKQADLFTLRHGEIISSSDTVLINKAERVVDLAGEIAKRTLKNKLLTLTKTTMKEYI